LRQSVDTVQKVLRTNVAFSKYLHYIFTVSNQSVKLCLQFMPHTDVTEHAS